MQKIKKSNHPLLFIILAKQRLQTPKKLEKQFSKKLYKKLSPGVIGQDTIGHVNAIFVIIDSIATTTFRFFSISSRQPPSSGGRSMVS